MVYPANALFEVDELMISRTDKRGVIMSANASFQRVSGYGWEELSKAPHKIVRHGDMPKGVFYLLWHYLQSNKPVAGFVKNATKDGGHYWVFASMVPLEDGYQSMRILPTQAGIDLVEPIYQKMREFEADKGNTPEQSAELLVTCLKEKGYADYDSFMVDMLATQLTARDQEMRTKADAGINRLRAILKDWPSVGEECDRVFTAYEEFGAAPLNMRIQASQLNDDGIALGVIASNFAELAGQINSGLVKFTASVSDVADTINHSVFLTCVQRLLRESETALAKDDPESPDVEILRRLRRSYASQSLEGLQDTMGKMSQFLSLAYSIKRSLSGLSVTRVMSAIENAQVKNNVDNSISAIIEELRVFQEVTDTSMMTIQGMLTRFRTEMQRSMKSNQPFRAAA